MNYQAYLDNIEAFMPVVWGFKHVSEVSRKMTIDDDLGAMWIAGGLQIPLTNIALQEQIEITDRRFTVVNGETCLTFIPYANRNRDLLLLNVKKRNNQDMSIGYKLMAASYDEDLSLVVYDAIRVR